MQLIAQDCPVADFSFSNTCLTQQTQFKSTTTGTDEETYYQWDFDSDANYDLVTKEKTAYWEFSGTGLYTVTLNIEADNNCSQNLAKQTIEMITCENCEIKTIIPNSSFEDNEACPQTLDAFDTSKNWFSGNVNTPDLFSQCAQNELTGIPINAMGEQESYSGDAYAGIMVYGTDDKREYISIELDNPLTKGVQYCISYKVSLAESSALAIAELGAVFSINSIFDSASEGRLEAKPQFEYHQVINDNNNWITVNGYFTANENYQFLTIGCFNENPTIQNVAGDLNQAYYYIDDVIVNPFIARVEPGTTICRGDAVELNAEMDGLCEVYWYSEYSPDQIFSNELSVTATPFLTTNYIFVARNACCFFQDTVTIEVIETKPPDAGPDVEICEGEATILQVSGENDFSWFPLTGIVNPTSALTETYPMETITYTLTTTTQNGCKAADDITVTVLPSPKIEITNSVVFCKDEPVQIVAFADGENTYQWSPAEGLSNSTIFNPVANPESTTLYTVTVTNENNCLSVSYTTVEVKESIEVPQTEPLFICAGSSIEITEVPNAVEYRWFPSTNISCTDCANPIINPIESTVYTLTFTDENACTGTVDYSINVKESIQLNLGEDQKVCNGQAIQLEALGLSPNVPVLWQPAESLDNPLNQTPVAIPTENTIYTLSILDESLSACLITDSIEIRIDGVGFADAGHDRFICAGDAILLKARGGIKYEWSPAIGLSSTNVFNPAARPESTTTYTVKVTNRSGCTVSDEITVSVGDIPNLIVNQNEITLCDGETTQLQSNGTGAFYKWEPSTGLSDPSIPNPVFTGDESITYTISNFNDENDKCIASEKINITVFNEAAIKVSEDVNICREESVDLKATGGTSYMWFPTIGLSDFTSSNPIATPDSTTTYEVTVQQGACSFTKSVTVTVSDQNKIEAGTDITICEGGEHQLQASGTSSYLWFPSEGLSNPTIANPVATPTETTTYFVQSGGNTSCASTDSVTIFVNNEAPIQLTESQTICAGDPVQLNANGGIQYTWSPPESLNNPTLVNPIATPLETTNYQVTVLNADGNCIAKGSVLIEVNENTNNEIIADAGEDFIICGGQEAQLNAGGGTIYQWIPSEGLSDPSISNPIAVLDTTTLFTVLVSNGNENDCPAKDEVEIRVEPGVNLVLDEGPLEICKGGSILLEASGASRYSWSPAESLDDPTIASPIASPQENTVYILNASNQRGSCKVVADVAVNILDLNAPEVSVSPDQIICLNQSVQLSATGGNNYMWQPSFGLNDANIPNPIANPGVSLNVQGADTFNWQPNLALSDPTIGNPIASPKEDITYTVQGSNQECTDEVTISIEVENTPDLIVSEDQTICSGRQAQLSVSGGSNYSWSPTNGLDDPISANPTASPDVSTTYQVTSSDGNCASSESITVFVDNASVPRLCTEPVVTQFICPQDFCSIREGDVFTELDNTYFFCSLDINKDGCIEYTALPLFFGVDTISITACNQVDTLDCQTLTAIMSVVEDCDAEQCENPVVALPCVQSGETIEVCPAFCLFDQLEGSGIEFYSIMNFTLNTPGSISLNDQCFSYTPPDNYIGPDVIKVTACSTIYPDYCNEATFVVDVMGDCGLKLEQTNTVSQHFKDDQNIKDFNPEFSDVELRIYPIPVTETLYLNWVSFEEGNYTLSINNVNGQRIFSDEYISKEGFQNLTIPISNLEKGLYFITIQKEGRAVAQKFLKQ